MITLSCSLDSKPLLCKMLSRRNPSARIVARLASLSLTRYTPSVHDDNGRFALPTFDTL